jgi:hypothetical protein
VLVENARPVDIKQDHMESFNKQEKRFPWQVVVFLDGMRLFLQDKYCRLDVIVEMCVCAVDGLVGGLMTVPV